MMHHLHKRFSDPQVKELFERYLLGQIEHVFVQQILGIKRRQFFILLKRFKQDPASFSIVPLPKSSTRKISPLVEINILNELTIEKDMIINVDIPIKSFNYSYIRDILQNQYQQKVSLPTIIDRAKKNGFYLKKAKRTIHDREVLTNYAGELIQHDSSHHLFAPAAKEKWYLITSLDDYSRFILYAGLVSKETSWTHIVALEKLFLKYGTPFSYYVDSHSIFRYVKGRDTAHRHYNTLTDDVDPQWKKVLEDCSVKITYALSPQAKGKIERPYGWLQDHLVRTCVRQNVNEITPAKKILEQEIQRYNYHQVHSTTKEVPYFRLKNALKEGKSLFRQFAIKPPFLSTKDIFCLRLERIASAYRKISLHNLELRVNKVNPHDILDLRIHPLRNDLCEIRFWRENELIDIQKIKKIDLKGVHF